MRSQAARRRGCSSARSCCRSPTCWCSTSNHLDLESINALNQAIQRYEGTVFLVTHDQDLIEEAGTRIWHFEGGPKNFHITDHKGPYEEYAQKLELASK